MTGGIGPSADARAPDTRFRLLFGAILFLLLSYPYFPENDAGAVLAGLVSLALLGAAVRANPSGSGSFRASLALAVLAGGLSLASLLGAPLTWHVEAAFAVFYAFTTWTVFRRVVTVERVTKDTLLGLISVYLLIGLTFGNVFDFLETCVPGSFVLNVTDVDPYIGFRRLLFYSYMTLTTVGYGDITPRTTAAQSLAIVEAVTGVLFVAVLIARVVGVYRRPEGGRLR